MPVNNSDTVISKYEDEIKYLIGSSEQLNEVYKRVKSELNIVSESEIIQNDGYLDDSDLTLYHSGASLRIRYTDSTCMKRHSIEMKLKDQIADSGDDGVYKRREVKKEISQQEQDDLDNGVSLNKVNPEFYELVCDLLSLPAIEFKKKFDLITTRKKLVVKDANYNQMTLHFDSMVYIFDGKKYFYYELEIKVNALNNPFFVFLNKVNDEFNLLKWTKTKYDRGIYLFRKACEEYKSFQGDDVVSRFYLTDSEKVRFFQEHQSLLERVYQDYIFHLPYLIREEQRILNELKIVQKDVLFENETITRRTCVHSFRSRVKDADHLIDKIIRKGNKYFNQFTDFEGNVYDSLTVDNYTSILTDMIGVRVLHLFKDNWLEIDNTLSRLYDGKIREKIFYIRKGDEIHGDNDLEALSRKHGFEFIEKESGYRSAHYLVKRDILVDSGDMFTTYAEIQVRTVFEEAWGEINHEIQYPHYQEDVMINNFLKTFNRIAGSADEMATYIKKYRDSLH